MSDLWLDAPPPTRQDLIDARHEGADDVYDMRCQCGDELRLDEVVGHLLSEGRLLPDAERMVEIADRLAHRYPHPPYLCAVETCPGYVRRPNP